MEQLLKYLKDMFTEDDNESADLMPVIAMLAVLVGIFLEIWVVAVIRTQAFDMTNFGLGISALLSALGLAFKLKRDAQTKPMAHMDEPAAGSEAAK